MAKRINPSISVLDNYIIKTKFQNKALVPHEAIDIRWFKLRCYNPADWDLKKSAIFGTLDYRFVKIKFIATCDNVNASINSWLETLCDELYGLKFSIFKSNWIARLGEISDTWHLIEMEEIIR